MSRIGNQKIRLEPSVSVCITSVPEKYSTHVKIFGPHGVITAKFLDKISIEINNEKTSLSVGLKDKDFSYHGLTRALLYNMIKGVLEPFVKTIIAEGVGYKFQINQNVVIIFVGFTKPIHIDIPSEVVVILESTTRMIIKGIHKDAVGSFAAKIRAFKPPEPYNGKGLRYSDEQIVKKFGKKGK